MADHAPWGDGLPTWLTAALSVVGTVASWKALGPVGRWLGRHYDVFQHRRETDYADLVGQLKAQLAATLKELVDLRLDLGSERELRMGLAIENAGLRRDVEYLTKQVADDKRECQAAIRGLRAEIAELRKQRGGP